MKERWIGVGLGAGALLALGAVWTDSAQAFSLGSSVTVTNILDKKGSGGTPIFDGPDTVTVAVGGTKLNGFGELWDITLTPGLISFSLNSPFFANVTSGADIYQFEISDFGPAGPFSLLKDKDKDKFLVTFDSSCIVSDDDTLSAAENTNLPCFQADSLPYAKVQSNNQIDVIFPLGFAVGDFREGPGSLKVFVAVDIPPTPVPTPALLPGLVGIGLAALRKRHQDSQHEDNHPK